MSLLSRNQNLNPQRKEADDRSASSASSTTSSDGGAGIVAPPPRPRQTGHIGGVTDKLADLVPLTGARLLDTGYEVPAKRYLPEKLAKLRALLRQRLLSAPDEADLWQRGDKEKEALLAGRLKTILGKMNADVSEKEFIILRECLLDDLLGFGAIQPLISDRRYSEVMVNGPQEIFAEFKGKIGETEIVFDDEAHVLWTAERIVRPLQRTINRHNPMVDARLPDGSRVHIVTAPSAIRGTTITIRKFPEKRLTMDDLVKFGSLTKDTADFLRACVAARINIVISGGTGSGKTTTLNVLSGYIPEDERIITIEDAAELQLHQRHIVSLETSPAIPRTAGGDGVVGTLTIRDLVRGALRMRPDRLVIGECRGGEALDMLQAMNTGHDGSLTTVHANTPRDSIGRLETLCLMAGMDLPLDVVRAQITSAVDLIVQQARLKDGSRKIVQITEVQGMEGSQVTLQDIFLYRTADNRGPSYSHEGGGELQATGFRPNFVDQLKQYGFRLSGQMFGAGRNTFE